MEATWGVGGRVVKAFDLKTQGREFESPPRHGGLGQSLPCPAHGRCTVAALCQGTKQIPCLSTDME